MATKKTATTEETAQGTDETTNVTDGATEETATPEADTEETTEKQEDTPDPAADTTDRVTEEPTVQTEEQADDKADTAASEATAVKEEPAAVSEATEEESANEAAQTVEEETETLVYIGPGIPGGKLRPAQIITGTDAQIKAFLGGITESYPEIGHLLVPVKGLAEAARKVQTKGNILHKYYEDVAAKATARKTGG
jgi:hypothetical protein